MNFRTTQFLFLFLAALAVYVYFFEWGGGKKHRKAGEAADHLVSMDADSLIRVTLLPAGITLQRTDSLWRLTRPIAAATDAWAVDGLINAVHRAKRRRSFDEGGINLAEFGLSPPRLGVVLEYNNAFIDTLLVGDETPVGDGVFVGLAGKKAVFITEKALRLQAAKNVFDFRDKRLLPFDARDIVAFSIDTGREKVSIGKQDKSWRLQRPAGSAPADANAVRQIMEALSSSRIRAFEPPAPRGTRGLYGLDEPALRLTLFIRKSPEPWQLFIGKLIENTYFARRSNDAQIIRLDSALVHALRKNEWALLDKRLVKFGAGEITSFEIRHGNDLLSCQREATNQWSMLQPKIGRPKGNKLAAVLEHLKALQARSIIGETAAARLPEKLDHAAIVLNLGFENHTHIVIGIGDLQGQYFPARTSTWPVTFGLELGAIQKLLASFEDLLQNPFEEELKQ